MALSETESKIEGLIYELNRKGKGVPKSISGFPELPFESYEALLADVQAGSARVFRLSNAMDPTLLSLLGKPSENFVNRFGMIFAFGGGLASIISAYFLGWWLLVLCPIAFALGSKTTRTSYNSAILRSATISEILFCFLYFYGQISVDVPSTGEHCFFDGETNPNGSTPEIVEMKRLGLPLTMESYLDFVYGGEVPEEGAELELDIPEEIALTNQEPLVSDERLAELGYSPQQIKEIQAAS